MKGIENLMHYLDETKKYDMNALFTSLPSVKKTKKDKEICLKTRKWKTVSSIQFEQIFVYWGQEADCTYFRI